MSLENSIAELTAAITTNNDLLRQVLAADEAKGGDTADKPKGTRKPKADKATETGTETSGETAGGAVTKESLEGKLKVWLGEFAKPEDKANPEGTHPEVLARKDALTKAFGQLKVKKLGELDQDGLTKLDNWYETKAKVVDKGHGVGRFVADPVEADGSEEDDEMVL